MKTCVIIPSYNGADTIAGLIQRLLQQGLEVLIINDGSEDNTARIAQENGAKVINNLKNEGKGAALIKGFKHLANSDFDAVITMDGDGQHLPEDVPALINAAQASNESIFIGNRMERPFGMPIIRQLTNKIMSWFVSVIVKQHIPDTQCGFRLIKKDLLQKLELYAQRYEIESEVLIKAARLGYKIESVPIASIYRQEKSQINPFLDTLRFIRFVIKEGWGPKSSK